MTKHHEIGWGFTLVEVLVALIIVAIALGAGLRASGMQINEVERAEQNLMAKLCAQNQLVALRLSRQYPGTGTNTLSCEQNGQTVTVQTQVTPTPNPSFRRIDVSVHPDEKMTQTWLHLATVIGRF